MNKMDSDYISRHDIARQYLKGKLTPEETVAFEEYILDKPELLEQLELDSVLAETLPKIKVTNKNTNSWFAWWRPVYSHTLATAASVALIAIFIVDGVIVDNNISNYSPEIVYVDNYRSTQPILNISFKQDEQNKMFVVSLPIEISAPLSVSLRQGDVSKVIVSNILANSESEIVLHLSPRDLLEGESEIVVIQSDNSREIISYGVNLSFR